MFKLECECHLNHKTHLFYWFAKTCYAKNDTNQMFNGFVGNFCIKDHLLVLLFSSYGFMRRKSACSNYLLFFFNLNIFSHFAQQYNLDCSNDRHSHCGDENDIRNQLSEPKRALSYYLSVWICSSVNDKPTTNQSIWMKYRHKMRERERARCHDICALSVR